jgi:hypothetical protein
MKNAKENLKEVTKSSVTFYRNGKSLGTAFENIYDGEYFPAISLYKEAKVCSFFFSHPFESKVLTLFKGHSKFWWNPVEIPARSFKRKISGAN